MIPITRPVVGDQEVAAAAAVIRSGWLTQGAKVAEFERAVCAYVGAGHAVATSSCTAALHLALVAAGVGPGDEVICPSLSFIATANAVLHAGATPVFVDIEPATLNIDARAVEAAITPRTACIMPVDQLGLAADIDAIGAIARRHGLPVVEDAAPALGANVGARRVGSLSTLTCFSFHPRKVITTGEGGMITTGDEGMAARLRSLRSHAASTSDLARHGSAAPDFEEYREVGYNYRMTDIQAAIGLVQVDRLEGILAERRRLGLRYNTLLAGLVVTPVDAPGREHTFQSYCVRLPDAARRPAVMAHLAARGIATRRGVMAIHLEPAYRGRFPGLSLPETESAAASTMLLPLFPGMGDAAQDEVVAALREALG
ncbi:MAG: DegT/DnrJ/EryC1/StrS family aminotransferase [Chloroflexi bacterium]|nr:DegT/DnrJ/EryC1/StrS family aminotransferase [Chloroflexota bacterium]